MKKFFILGFILCISLLFLGTVNAEEGYWLSTQNVYYQRSQHTYSFTNLNGEHHTAYAPALYVILNDQDNALNGDSWEFKDSYQFPYSVDLEDYFLVLCADLDVPILRGAEYTKVSINESTYLDDSVKRHISGILKHSYPFISKEAMIEELVAAGVLVEREDEDGEKYLTASTNSVAYNTITTDELLSAIQMAIFYYTNKDEIEKNYYSTYVLSTNTVVTGTEIGNNIYPKGYFGVVNNNIQAIYEYLITLEEDSESNYIEQIEAQSVENGYYFRVSLNEKVTDKDDFTLELSLDGEKIGNYILNDLEQDEDGRYIFLVENLEDVTNLKVRLIGKNYIEDSVDVYEAVGGKSVSQTLVGISSRYRDVEVAYEAEFLTADDIFIPEEPTPEVPVKNPNTTDSIIVFTALGVVLCLMSFSLLKKYKFYR